MKIVFVSNALSHHQIPLCDELSLKENVDFTYVATKPISSERLNMGYTDYHKTKSYVLSSYASKENYKKAKKLIDDADFVICGSVPLGIVIKRVFFKKPIFWAAERIYKTRKLSLKNRIFRFITITLSCKKNTRLLSSSAYAASDFKKFGLPEKNAYKWGYFPPTVQKKQKEKSSIVWVGRFLGGKHPELALQLAAELNKRGFNFTLSMVGGGEKEEELKNFVKEKGLSDKVVFKGFLSNEQTREEIGKSEIMICTSDKSEGWGAVVNEGMSAGCAVVASSAMGSVPYLIKDGENGFIFKSGDLEELTEKTSRLLEDEKLLEKAGDNAERYIEEEFNGKVACERLLKVLSEFEKGNTYYKFSGGICSAAELLDNDWY